MNLKSTLSLLSLVAGAIATHAQPTLTAITSTPVAGLSEVYNQDTVYLAGPEGANQSWDFSARTFPTVSNMVFEACNSSNNCATFPGTTVVGHQDAKFLYYGGSAGALSITGESTGGVNIPFSDPQDFLRFPFTYNDSYTDTWAATLTNSGMTFHRSGIDSVTADGWGTLKTPAGTFTNTLRVKRISTYKDSTNTNGMPIEINYRMELYSWHDLTHKDVLYSTFSLVVNALGNVSTTNGSTFISTATPPPPTGIKTAFTNALNLNIAPNPARDLVRLSLTLTERSNVNISIIDVTGRSVYHAPHSLPAGSSEVVIATSDMPSGIYMMKVSTGNMTTTSKLVVQK